MSLNRILQFDVQNYCYDHTENLNYTHARTNCRNYIQMITKFIRKFVDAALFETKEKFPLSSQSFNIPQLGILCNGINSPCKEYCWDDLAGHIFLSYLCNTNRELVDFRSFAVNRSVPISAKHFDASLQSEALHSNYTMDKWTGKLQLY